MDFFGFDDYYTRHHHENDYEPPKKKPKEVVSDFKDKLEKDLDEWDEYIEKQVNKLIDMKVNNKNMAESGYLFLQAYDNVNTMKPSFDWYKFTKSMDFVMKALSEFKASLLHIILNDSSKRDAFFALCNNFIEKLGKMHNKRGEGIYEFVNYAFPKGSKPNLEFFGLLLDSLITASYVINAGGEGGPGADVYQ